MLSWASRAALHRDLFNLGKVVPGVLRHHCSRFFLVESPNTWGNIAQESYLNIVNPECIILNLCGPTLHKAITSAMLADSPQSNQCCVNTSDTQRFVEQVTSAMLAKSAQSSFHRKITYTAMLSWSAWVNIGQEITCAILTHSPWTTLHKKIIYNFVRIYLSQCCTRTCAMLAHMADRQCMWGK